MDLTPPPGIDLQADQAHRIISANIVLIVLPTIFVIARLVSRQLARAGYWWDDVWVLAALSLSFGPCICVLVSQKHNGFGRHIYVLGPQNTMEFLKILYVYQVFYVSAVCAVKACILAFYRRIFHVKQLQFVVYLFAGVVFAFFVGSILLTFFQCTPVSHFWLRTSPGYCVNGDNVMLGIGGVNCVLDFLIVMLPIPLLWRLRTTTSQKGVLTGVFLTAGFVCIISIIRLVVLSRLDDVDVTWNYVSSGIWSAAEPSAGVIAACIPSLRPLISLLLRGTVRGLGVSKYGSTGRMSSREDSVIHSRSAASRKFSDSEAGYFPSQIREASASGARKGSRVGHNVEVLGGKEMGCRGEEDEISLEAVNVPHGVIRVKNEIVVTSADWLDYQDKVY